LITDLAKCFADQLHIFHFDFFQLLPGSDNRHLGCGCTFYCAICKYV